VLRSVNYECAATDKKLSVIELADKYQIILIFGIVSAITAARDRSSCRKRNISDIKWERSSRADVHAMAYTTHALAPEIIQMFQKFILLPRCGAIIEQENTH
jgi:hypothetical protein